MHSTPLTLALCAALLAAPAVHAQDASASTSTATVEPKALAALDAMGKYLRSLKTFTVHGDSTLDLVMEDGEKLQFPGTVDYKVRTPNGLHMDIKTDRKERQLFYDGKSLTVYGSKNNYYATVDAPPTIKELLGVAADRYDIEFPLADLFLWGTERAPTSALKSATFVGPARIGGTVTEQYAFRQEGVDWQVWIEAGSKPLPRRLVITTTDDPTHPQYASTLTWNTSPSLSDANFTFTPPKDAKRIQLVAVDVPAAGDEEGKP
ncbi:DUF2092 domain-containing protein [Lysobacter niastensis]|uniref:DUF2092 domain-containing protein n=1 Tax=Lysobacter niastensis TaxID=380629 RepID=A0ABS0B436_9GAMM|nr:DUF2092 domain-containing protein [Lysobacter niastensis]MBF6023138.1 DUF2092 domain-containing protein [Lysobacter niastensis]